MCNRPEASPEPAAALPDGTQIPHDYVAGYEKARAENPAMAENYVAHTHVGDPLADELMADFQSMGAKQSAAWTQRAIDNPDDPALRDAPTALQRIVEDWRNPPAWHDPGATDPAIRYFHRHSATALAAMLGGVLVEGFATNISRSFFITGRLRDAGVRRLRQNNRHMIEIFLPGGLDERGDGWKLSVRIRFVHARVRNLLTQAGEWETEEWGVPLCAAHLGFALTAFSARMLEHMRSLGCKYSDEERDGFMSVWRYTGHLMGIPDTILYQGFDDARELFRIGNLCEPEVGMESVAMANALINSAPLVAGDAYKESRRKLVKYIFRVSRAMIGGKMADNLLYPPARTAGVLPWFRLQQRYQGTVERFTPALARKSQFNAFNTLLEVSALDEIGITYDLPDHVYAEKSRKW